ncbi:MAG: aldose epimerase family protein [Cetobacterium sp.]|uniref:aldose epimerase family protein n=1 Tax=Cetobacterium sp. TaxID=2071632 RepID=UPI003F32DFF9
MKLNITEFGRTFNGEQVFLYSLKNEFVDLEIISLGGIIKSLKTPDKNGNFENIVLGYKTLLEYEKNEYFYGCITGRVAGRTKNGVLKIGDEIYELEKNNGGNNLHGGPSGLNTKVWEGGAKVSDDKGVVTLTYKSPHLENGFPGEVDFKVIYTLEKNELKIEYFGDSDRDTYINLTNHTYFNLSGNAKYDIKEQFLKVNAKGYGWVDENTVPLKMEREDNFLNFENFQKLRDILQLSHKQIEIVGGGIDHPFELSKKYNFDIELKDEESGRNIKVKSSEPVAVIYTGNFLDKKHNGICFEMQDYPDIFNFMPEKAKIYNNKIEYYTYTTFEFNN